MLRPRREVIARRSEQFADASEALRQAAREATALFYGDPALPPLEACVKTAAEASGVEPRRLWLYLSAIGMDAVYRCDRDRRTDTRG